MSHRSIPMIDNIPLNDILNYYFDVWDTPSLFHSLLYVYFNYKVIPEELVGLAFGVVVLTNN